MEVGHETKLSLGFRMSEVITPSLLEFAAIDEKTDLGRFLAASDLPNEIPEAIMNLFDRAGDAASAEGVEQVGSLYGNSGQSRQRRLHPLNKIVADLLREFLALEEGIDGSLLSIRQQINALPGGGIIQVVEQRFVEFSIRASSCWSIWSRTATPLAPRFSSCGRKLQCGQIGRGIEVILDQGEASQHLGQP